MVVLEEKRADVAASDFAVIQRELRINHVSADHPVGLREIVLIVTIHASECDNGRNGVTSTPRATGALLIVCAPRRHVAQSHAGQCANIDSNLHRCGARKNVNRRGTTSLTAK